jgi:type VI secretion system protein VasG
LQGDSPLILPTVDEQAVASVVQDWTGVPVGRMVKNEVESVLRLADTLNQRVIGQKHALDMIARRIQTSRARLDNPNKPIGVFMLCGTSGVGKTETGAGAGGVAVRRRAEPDHHQHERVPGGAHRLHAEGRAARLRRLRRGRRADRGGAPRPYSVVLLDEVEKAHPDVHELFFQVFDKGWMEDGEGRGIDFKNTIILLTSNVGSELIAHVCRDPARMPEPEAIAKALREPLLQVFPAALLGRLVVVPYYPLSDEMMGNIVRLQLGRIGKRVADNHGIPSSTATTWCSWWCRAARGGVGRARGRCDPDQHRAAAHLARVPAALTAGPGAQGRAPERAGRRLRLRASTEGRAMPMTFGPAAFAPDPVSSATPTPRASPAARMACPGHAHFPLPRTACCSRR